MLRFGLLQPARLSCHVQKWSSIPLLRHNSTQRYIEEVTWPLYVLNSPNVHKALFLSGWPAAPCPSPLSEPEQFIERRLLISHQTKIPTYHFQDSLPKLKLPKLEESIAKVPQGSMRCVSAFTDAVAVPNFGRATC